MLRQYPELVIPHACIEGKSMEKDNCLTFSSSLVIQASAVYLNEIMLYFQIVVLFPVPDPTATLY